MTWPVDKKIFNDKCESMFKGEAPEKFHILSSDANKRIIGLLRGTESCAKVVQKRQCTSNSMCNRCKKLRERYFVVEIEDGKYKLYSGWFRLLFRNKSNDNYFEFS
jgi:hypothetical protein